MGERDREVERELDVECVGSMFRRAACWISRASTRGTMLGRRRLLMDLRGLVGTLDNMATRRDGLERMFADMETDPRRLGPRDETETRISTGKRWYTHGCR